VVQKPRIGSEHIRFENSKSSKDGTIKWPTRTSSKSKNIEATELTTSVQSCERRDLRPRETRPYHKSWLRANLFPTFQHSLNPRP